MSLSKQSRGCGRKAIRITACFWLDVLLIVRMRSSGRNHKFKKIALASA